MTLFASAYEGREQDDISVLWYKLYAPLPGY